MIDKLIDVLAKTGPLTGQELAQRSALDTFSAWKQSSNAERIVTRIAGKRYLRLDMKVENFARLSPSIMREFLNYTIVGLEGQETVINTKAEQLEKTLTEISIYKAKLARETIKRLVKNHPERNAILSNTCFIIAGDIVFGMAHAEPRPEFSTGELVRGSDLDIIAVTAGLSDRLVQSLDALIYKEKYNLLMNPAIREEIDYIIKDLATVEEQLKFEDFKAMVASKILDEGNYLYGCRDLFNRIKKMLIEKGTREKINMLEERAKQNRIDAENCLKLSCDNEDRDQLMALFYTTEEKEEIF